MLKANKVNTPNSFCRFFGVCGAFGGYCSNMTSGNLLRWLCSYACERVSWANLDTKWSKKRKKRFIWISTWRWARFFFFFQFCRFHFISAPHTMTSRWFFVVGEIDNELERTRDPFYTKINNCQTMPQTWHRRDHKNFKVNHVNHHHCLWLWWSKRIAQVARYARIHASRKKKQI